MNAVYVIFVFVECGSRFQLHKMSLVPFSAKFLQMKMHPGYWKPKPSL